MRASLRTPQLEMLVATTNQTTVSPAMPVIVAELGGIEPYSWIAASTLLAVAVSVPTVGKLSDIYGRRGFYIGGLLVFMLGSVLAGAAQEFWWLFHSEPSSHGAYGYILHRGRLRAPSREGGGPEKGKGGTRMKRMLARLVALSLFGMLVFAPSAWAQGQEVTVSMEDNFFEQANITVEPGTTVTWVQNGDNPHTTTSYDGLWDSGMLEGGSGDTFSFTFDEPGTYDYFCIPHEDLGMVGSVTVSDAATASPTATATASPTATATASPEATALSETGGSPTSLLATLAASLALVVLGVAAFALVRRSASS